MSADWSLQGLGLERTLGIYKEGVLVLYQTLGRGY